MTIIVVCLYDRYENLKKWLHSWQFCNKKDAKLFIVHNTEIEDTSNIKKVVEEKGAYYIKRENIGFETGIIQDVVSGRILAEQNWDVLISATDDTFPMNKDFVEVFVQEVKKPDIGVVCIEMSGQYTPHIRTSGFAITKKIAEKITFPAQIVDKQQCYDFEHQGGEHTLLSQILRMNKRAIQLSNLKTSIMWDTHHRGYLNRWQEWLDEFPGYT